MLNLATASDTNTFYDKCKVLGVNMDVLLRWMAANNIASADAARQMARALTASANQPLHAIPTVSLLKAA
jgi:hypothetical protein